MQNIIEEVTKDQLRTDHPDFRAGDTVKVHVKGVEGSRERIQVFEGVVIKRQGGGISETFTVSKISYGVGCESTFPVHYPLISEIDVSSSGFVRLGELSYLRIICGNTMSI